MRSIKYNYIYKSNMIYHSHYQHLNILQVYKYLLSKISIVKMNRKKVKSASDRLWCYSPFCTIYMLMLGAVTTIICRPLCMFKGNRRNTEWIRKDPWLYFGWIVSLGRELSYQKPMLLSFCPLCACIDSESFDPGTFYSIDYV